MNPCPCGYFSDATRECRCTPGIIQRYLGKISGPLLDRIDIHLEVPAVAYKELRGDHAGEGSAEIRRRVERVRAAQKARGYYNARLPSRLIRKHCVLDDAGERTLEMAVRRMGLSRARTTGSSRWRAPSPTSTGRTPSPPSTWPRRCSTGAWTGTTGAEGRGPPDGRRMRGLSASQPGLRRCGARPAG